MPTPDDPDEVPVTVARDGSEQEREPDQAGPERADQEQDAADGLRAQLEESKKEAQECRDKLLRAMADFQNLERKTREDIENGISAGVDALVLDFLGIYDEFVLARESFAEGGADTSGLDSILKNMDSLLKKHDVAGIDALGGQFDPRFHEAISTVSDPGREENTVVREIRKGYISRERVIRPTLVEISKRE